MSQPGSGLTLLHVGTVDGIFTVEVDLALGGAQLYSASLRGSPIHAIAVNPDDPKVVVAGSGDPGSGLYYSRDGGLTWEAPGMWRVGREAWSVAFEPRDPRVVWAGAQPAAIYRSRDIGYTWDRVGDLARVPGHENWTFPRPPHEAHIRKLAFHPRRQSRLLAAVEVGGLLVSDDAGVTWRVVDDVDPDVHSVCFWPGDDDVSLAATGRGLFRTEGNDVWDVADPNLADRYVVSLIVEPVEPWRIYTLARGARALVSVSHDGGQHFQPLSEELPAPEYGVDALAIHPRNPKTLVYGARESSNGSGCLYVSHDGAHTWTKLNGELKFPPVTRVAIA